METGNYCVKNERLEKHSKQVAMVEPPVEKHVDKNRFSTWTEKYYVSNFLGTWSFLRA